MAPGKTSLLWILCLCFSLVPSRPARGTELEGEARRRLARLRHAWLLQRHQAPDFASLWQRGFEVGSREVEMERQRMRALARTPGALAAAPPAWTSIGPTSRPDIGFGYKPGNDLVDSGEVVSIAPHPTDPRTFWIGTAFGGVWKTMDAGTTWTALTDNAALLPIGAVAVAPSNPLVVYAGMGTGDGSGPDAAFYGGKGLLISTDGGSTWRLSNTSPASLFWAISVDPADPRTLVIAGDKGVRRSTDGGDTWSPSLTTDGWAVTVSRPASNPLVLYAGTYGIDSSGNDAPGSVWKSTDGGQTFRNLKASLPASVANRCRVQATVAPSDVNVVYALIATLPDASYSYATLDMIKTTDGGQTWTALGLVGKKVPILGDQGEFANVVTVDPQNASVVYAGGLDLWKTADGGGTWKKLSRWDQDYSGSNQTPYVHADHHAIAFSADRTMYFGNDGGVFTSSDGGASFRSVNEGLATTLFYTLCESPAAPDLAMGGNQDDGTSLRIGATSVWSEPGVGGDGFGCLVHPTNPNVMWATVYNVDIYRSTDGGLNWAEVVNGLTEANGADTPFDTILRRHPADPYHLFTRSNQRIWESKNGGDSWSTPSGVIPGVGTIYDFSLFPGDGARMAIVDDGSKVFESTDGGKTWVQRGKLPVGAVTTIRYDRSDPARMFAASLIYAAGKQRVFSSTDGGAHWTAISQTGQASGLPDVPVMTLEQDPNDPNALWAGTYVGVYRSGDRGASWQRYGQGLPNTIVYALTFGQGGTRLRAGTFGRGVWEIPVAQPTNKQLLLSQQRVAVTVTWRSQYDDSSGVATPLPQKDGFGYFYFSNASNPEVFTKVLDFGPSRPYLVFFAGLTDFEYTVSFTVLATGQTLVFHKAAGTYNGGFDAVTLAHSMRAGETAGVTFAEASLGLSAAEGPAPLVDGPQLVLSQGRIAVQVAWRSQYDGSSGAANVIPQQDQFGFFYFSDPDNPEVFVKVLDFGTDRPYLLFFGGLTDFEYTVTFTNLATGVSKSFLKPAGSYIGLADGSSLPH